VKAEFVSRFQSAHNPRFVSAAVGGLSVVLFAAAGKEFAAERRGEIEATVKKMEADAAAAEQKLRKINEAGKQSWSALMTALSETRTSFDKANQAAQDAFKRAA
jgi:hypothetical protein